MYIVTNISHSWKLQKIAIYSSNGRQIIGLYFHYTQAYIIHSTNFLEGLYGGKNERSLKRISSRKNVYNKLKTFL